MYQALYRKYRPLSFADVVGQEAVTRTLTGQLASGKVGHAYLFTGTRGTGKTSCAKIFARAVNCEHPIDGSPCNECAACRGILEGSVTDVFEMDAASNNSVDNVRELREDVIYTPAVVRYKVYIIDEVHRMSGPAFDALLKTIEEPPAHVIFILATTELHKVPATILSRCQRFDFRRIDTPDIAGRLRYVAEKEGIDLSEEASNMLARMGQGSMRDALSLLERATALEGRVDAAAVGDLLGLCDPAVMMDAIEAIADGNTAAVLRFLNDMWRASKDIGRLLSEMAVLLRDIALSDVAPELVATGRSAEEISRMAELLRKMGRGGVLDALETLQKGMRDIVQCTDSRVMTEITLMRMCDPRLSTTPSAMVARLEALEKGAPRKTPQAPAAQPAAPEKSASPVMQASPAAEEIPLPDEPPLPLDAPPAPVQKTPATKPAEAPAVNHDKNWELALDILRQEGRQDVLSILLAYKPTFEGHNMIFTIESGFMKMRLEQDIVKEAILGAMKKVDGQSYQLRFATPPAPKPEYDPLDDLINEAGIEIIE